MSGAAFRIVPLEAAHDRRTFEGASAMLDRYFFRHQITQDIRRKVTASFMALITTVVTRSRGELAAAYVFVVRPLFPSSTSLKKNTSAFSATLWVLGATAHSTARCVRNASTSAGPRVSTGLPLQARRKR